MTTKSEPPSCSLNDLPIRSPFSYKGKIYGAHGMWCSDQEIWQCISELDIDHDVMKLEFCWDKMPIRSGVIKCAAADDKLPAAPHGCNALRMPSVRKHIVSWKGSIATGSEPHSMPTICTHVLGDCRCSARLLNRQNRRSLILTCSTDVLI